MASTNGTGSPCGACKFLRRKCAAECIFAPYFCSEQGAARFAAIHKVFGASNVSKLLLHVPVPDRCEAVVTIAYEAQARIRDPVHGCVSHIFALQQQVAYLQAQLMQVKSQLAQKLIDQSSSRNAHDYNYQRTNTGIINGNGTGSFPFQNFHNYNYSSVSPQSSLDSIDHGNINGNFMNHETQSCSNEVASFQPYSSNSKRPPQTDLSELQAVAFRMMKNEG